MAEGSAPWRDDGGSGRVAVVTGAGGGLGLELAGALVEDGCRVALFERDREQAERAAERLAERFGSGSVRGFAADQESPEAVSAAFEAAIAWAGVPTTVVANAGYAKFGALLDTPARTWSRHVAINLTGTFLVCQAAARAMASAGLPGSITVISSSLARAHSDQVGAYCVTKAALLPLVRSFAAELGAHGIRVNAVLPGVIETPMTSAMLDRGMTREALLQDTPAGRMGAPSDIVSAVRFLSGDGAGWVTGATLDVDGGQSIYGQPQWIRQDRSAAGAPQWRPGLERGGTLAFLRNEEER